MRCPATVGSTAESASQHCLGPATLWRSVALPAPSCRLATPSRRTQLRHAPRCPPCRAVGQGADTLESPTTVVDISYDDGFEGEFCSARPSGLPSKCVRPWCRAAHLSPMLLSRRLLSAYPGPGPSMHVGCFSQLALQKRTECVVSRQCRERLPWTTSPTSGLRC
jgi:hypothetical protein